MAEHSLAQVRANALAMVLDDKQTIERMFEMTTICPETSEWWSQMVSIRLPENTDMDKLSKIMHESYHIEMPLITWNNYKLARLSVQIYTSQEELDAFVEGITTHVPACLISEAIDG